MKSTKRSLIMSALTVLLCVCMLIGTTYAWFSDTVRTGNNIIEAGNLDVEVMHTNAYVTTPENITGRTDLFPDAEGSSMKWEPGAISYECFTVMNVGELAFKFNSLLDIIDFNTLNGHSLKEALRFKVLTGSSQLNSITRETVEALSWSTADSLESLLNDAVLADGRLSRGESLSFQIIVYWLPTENDSVYNARNGVPLNVEFGIEVVAYQDTVEADAFGANYDTNADAPCNHRYQYSYTFGANNDGTAIICTATAICPKCHQELKETVGCKTTATGSGLTHETKDFESDGVFAGKHAAITFTHNGNGHSYEAEDNISFMDSEQANSEICKAKNEVSESKTCICCGGSIPQT